MVCRPRAVTASCHVGVGCWSADNFSHGEERYQSKFHATYKDQYDTSIYYDEYSSGAETIGWFEPPL
jgi:hypothetical protein